MKADLDKTTAITEVVSSHPGETRPWSQKWGRNNTRAGQNPLVDWKNELQKYEAGRK